MNPDRWFTREIGKTEVYDPSFTMRTENSTVDLSDRLKDTANFISKLNERYPSYKFSVNEYKEFLVTKLA